MSGTEPALKRVVLTAAASLGPQDRVSVVRLHFLLFSLSLALRLSDFSDFFCSVSIVLVRRRFCLNRRQHRFGLCHQ